MSGYGGCLSLQSCCASTANFLIVARIAVPASVSSRFGRWKFRLDPRSPKRKFRVIRFSRKGLAVLDPLIKVVAPRGSWRRKVIRPAWRRFYLGKALYSNHRSLSKEQERQLIAHCFPDPAYRASPAGRQAMAANTHERLETARGAQIPWLNSIRRLGGARILEIGSGTGASSVALAEQGAIVTGIDINSSALEVASLRCSLYGLRAEYLERNATEAASISCAKDADFIIFWASLEHMTIRERLDAIRSAWHVLKPGACLVVVNSPNRLWHTDVHTSLEPFYHWLPDDLAYPYSRLTTRANFNSRFVDDSD